jgi:hypothetical protein
MDIGLFQHIRLGIFSNHGGYETSRHKKSIQPFATARVEMAIRVDLL